MINLRPCPFCDAIPKVYGEEGHRQVRCLCGASGPREENNPNIFYHWNFRKDREGFDMQQMRPEGEMKSGLFDFCRELPRDWHVVELGCYAGESSNIFADHFRDGVLFCIDPWEKGIGPEGENWSVDKYNAGIVAAEKMFDSMRLSYPHLYKLKGFDKEFVDMFADRSLDLVYVDCDHTYESTKEIIERWLPKIKLGGIISGHDYFTDTPGVIRAVDELVPRMVGPLKTFVDRSWRLTMPIHTVSNDTYDREVREAQAEAIKLS